MTLPETPTKPRLTKAFQQLRSLHWWMAACFLLLYLTGLVLPRLFGPASRGSLLTIHKSLGVLILGLLIVRIALLIRVFWRNSQRRSPNPTPSWLQALALHSLLYGFMLAVPLSGLFFSNAGNHDVVFLGLIRLPRLFAVNHAAAEWGESLHVRLAFAFLVAIVLHMLMQRNYLINRWRRITRTAR